MRELTDDELDAWLTSVKHCSGCDKDLPRMEFPTSTAHGQLVIRSRCRDCMKAYYRRNSKLRYWLKQRAADLAKDWDEPWYDEETAKEIGCA